MGLCENDPGVGLSTLNIFLPQILRSSYLLARLSLDFVTPSPIPGGIFGDLRENSEVEGLWAEFGDSSRARRLQQGNQCCFSNHPLVTSFRSK